MNLKLPEIKLSKEQQKKIAIGAVGALVALFCYWRFFFSPVRSEIVENKTRIFELEGKLNTAKSRAGQLELLKKQLENMKTEIAQAEKRLPRQKAVADLLDILTETSRRYRVTVLSFQPQGVGSKEYYAEIPFALSVETSYHTLALFLTSLGQSERILSVRGLTLAPRPPSKERPDVSISASFTLVAYQYKG